MGLTWREKQVFVAMTREPVSSDQLADAAGISACGRRETAARYAIRLVDKGLAVRHGSRMNPRWALSDAGAAFQPETADAR